jgi:tRNA pseudouridine synthase 10
MAKSASPISWAVHSIPRPIYLLGRYRKLARDVPQSRWTLGDERKGRNSVEEIISDVLVECLQAKSCKMHPCGREDIDVRCLGNGRPFIVEVSQARAWPVDTQLAAAIRIINSSTGMNEHGDVEVPSLALSDRSVWEMMQTVAEEKRKAYTCVCWSAARITPEILKVLEDISTDPLSVDEDGRPCLKVTHTLTLTLTPTLFPHPDLDPYHNPHLDSWP